ncbi:hypothetical protein GCM10022225_65280 [Plantactinospora mayteni]|uniref:Uncharacterized protein n=1 Tax=Plantactinospora mayteni TaxID=566021 RepID=A0ABQ4F0F7_9ACTN|nr:hypothetical protein Pma05_69730 [Plantactinospora mayteni]
MPWPAGAAAPSAPSLYNTIPAGTERTYLEVAGAGHQYIGQPGSTLARIMILMRLRFPCVDC